MKKRNFALTVLSACTLLSTAATQAQTRIMPLGDSVTSSFAPHSSYRYWLDHKLASHGYSFDFVGRDWGVANGAPSNTDFDMNHEGHPGWTTQDAVENINAIVSANVPDVVLLDLGANDVEQDSVGPAQSATNLIEIIDTLRSANPDVVVLLALPTPYAGQNKKGISRLKDAIRKVARVEKKSGARIRVLDLGAGFSVRKDTFDGTHPNESGEKKIARIYYSALAKHVSR